MTGVDGIKAAEALAADLLGLPGAPVQGNAGTFELPRLTTLSPIAEIAAIQVMNAMRRGVDLPKQPGLANG